MSNVMMHKFLDSALLWEPAGEDDDSQRYACFCPKNSFYIILEGILFSNSVHLWVKWCFHPEILCWKLCLGWNKIHVRRHFLLQAGRLKWESLPFPKWWVTSYKQKADDPDYICCCFRQYVYVICIHAYLYRHTYGVVDQTCTRP